MKNILILLSLAFSITANAGFIGKWSGPTNYTDSEGYKNNFLMKIYFLPYDQNHIYYSNSFTGHHLDLEIRGGELFLEKIKMGIITENQFILNVYNETCVGKMTAILDQDGNIEFADKYNCKDGYNYLTQGFLTKSK